VVAADALRVAETEEVSNIQAVDHFVMAVAGADARLEEVSRQLLARVYKDRIAEAVSAPRLY